MTFQEHVQNVEVLVFNMVNFTSVTHSYGTLYKLCHFASNVPVVTNANVTRILQCQVTITQRDHQNIRHTSYLHFHNFAGPRPYSSTF